MTSPTTAPPDAETRPVALWLVVTLVVMVLLAVLAILVASKGQSWGFKSDTLHIAAVHYPEEITPLIRSGRDVNELMNGRTPLQQAVEFKQVASVRALLHHGADPNLFDPGGATSPAVASSGVIHHGDPPTGPPLASALLYLNVRKPEDREILLLLLDAGADPNHTGKHRGTWLQKAARYNDMLLAQRLLDVGADVNAQGQIGRTPLHEAVEAGNPMLVDLLLSAGADPSIADDRGRTPADISEVRRFDESLQKRLQPNTP